jgi:DNA-binding MarR family transcriptional regulator
MVLHMAHDPLDRLIWHIGRAFYAYIGRLELVLAETGLDEHLRPGMGPILFALFQEDDCSIKEIGARVQLSSSTLTGLLVRMERAKLIERRRDPEDGRVVRVRLTSLGRSLEPRCRQALQSFDALVAAALDESEIGAAKDLVRRFTAAMRNSGKE